MYMYVCFYIQLLTKRDMFESVPDESMISHPSEMTS